VNAWQSLSGTVTIGGTETRKYARVWTLINTTAGSTGRWWFRNTSVRRKNGGNLVVDGSITAAKLSVSTLSAITADLGTITAGLIKNSAGSSKFDVANGRIVFNNGTVMCANGIGFGSSSQFIYWIGPSTGAAGAEDLSLCTEANAKFFVKTDGTVKFAGILQVGQTVNGASGSVLNSTNVADLGPFTSAGGTITVNTTFAFHGQVNFAGTTAGLTSYNATTKQSPNIVLVLSRSINGGAFSDVATYTPSSSHSETAPIPASSDPGIYEQFSNGSWTYTDSAHLAQNREFKVRITTFSSINSTVDQNTIAIQSIE
jgi:hypothetical protein